MGGGSGFRAMRATASPPASRFAMPEAAIGFCDVGVNAILYQTAEHRALAFLLSGMPVAAADAMALGLADAMVPGGTGRASRPGDQAALAADPDTAIAAIIGGVALDQEAAEFCAAADTLRLAKTSPLPISLPISLRSPERRSAASAFIRRWRCIAPRARPSRRHIGWRGGCARCRLFSPWMQRLPPSWQERPDFAEGCVRCWSTRTARAMVARNDRRVDSDALEQVLESPSP